MYPVSEAFLSAVQENTRRYYWTGKITTKAGVVHEFSEKEIIKGSGYISAQCCGSTEMELGTVYVSEMGITLFLNVDRYTLEDALVELFYHLELDDGSWEEVPMGIFEISEANRKIKCLEIKAYDYMLRFDETFNGFETVGNAYDFMELCSKACRVELAQTREEIEAMPNGAEVLSVYTENDIETYRDMLFYVGQVLGGFFCINRFGKLELRKYGAEPVMEIGSRHRFTSSFSDFITRYTAVSYTNLKTEMSEYYALDPDDGLTMNLGTNPLLQFGVDETRKELCTNVLNDLGVINYSVYDWNGNVVYAPSKTSELEQKKVSYRVRVGIKNLNIRKGPGTNYDKTGKYTGIGVFTIVAEADGEGATKWGKLKSGAGWISLDYGKKI